MFLTSYTQAYTSHDLCPCSVSVLGTSRGVHLGLVDLPFFLIDSDFLLAYCWSVGSICLHCAQLASAILLSYLI